MWSQTLPLLPPIICQQNSTSQGLRVKGFISINCKNIWQSLKVLFTQNQILPCKVHVLGLTGQAAKANSGDWSGSSSESVQGLHCLPFLLHFLDTKLDNHNNYSDVPKSSDSQVWANTVNPDQTAPGSSLISQEQSDQSTLFALPSASFGCITLW